MESALRRPLVRPLVAAGVVLGLGLGGFLDGILLHQILQWHHLASAVEPDPALNARLDGYFHLAMWLLVVLGLVLLARAWRQVGVTRAPRVLWGSVLAGAGAFHLVDGVVNHYVLAIHHIRPDGPGGALAWDAAFLALGALLLLAGWGLVRSHAREETRAGSRYRRITREG